MTQRVSSARAATALGHVLVAATERGVCLLALDARRGARLLRAWVARHAPAAVVQSDDAALEPALAQLAGYANGQRRRFELDLDLRGTPFQRAVWDEMQRIPFGRTTTYGELARRLGRPGASRAVGHACGANPVPIVVPCHRVVAREGLGGFSAGLQRKRALLAHEGLHLPLGVAADGPATGAC